MRKVLLAAGMMILTHSAMAQLLTGAEASKFHASAQLVRMDERSGSPLFISFENSSYIPASSGMESFRTILNASSDDSWQLIRNDVDDIGMNHHRFQQYYRGVPVVTGEYILHEKNGKIVSANGMFYDRLSLSASPAINETMALQNALNEIGASVYLWETSDREQEATVGHSHGRTLPQGELVILPSLNNDKKDETTLCWKFDIYSIQPHERYHIYVNANDGRVMFKENRICTFVANGSGNTKYSGTQSFTTDSLAPGSFRLRDLSRGNGVETYDLNNGTSYAAAVDFTDTDNVWTTTTNQDDAALDAHWGTQKTYDYYMGIHGRNSYNNAGAVLRSYVHYSSNYNNAFWNGSQMTYGDGNGTTFSPLTELDIIAHELTHGVTNFSSNLVYSYQSGALNESFSDIFGITVDFYARPGTANWKLGDQCYTPGTAGDALRYMDNPNAAGDPDCYLGTYWYTGTGDNGGVHTNSGVQNFWFYLLSVGGSGTNDVGFNYNVTGITMNKARMIAYRNNTFYLTSGSQFSDAAFYSLQSATDLYGNCSPEAFAVKNAWDAVNVTGLQLNANANVTVSSACSGGTIQFNATGGTSFVWSGPGGFSSTLSNPSITGGSAANNGVYTCTVTDANGCSSSKTVNVNVLPAPTVSASGGAAICAGNAVTLSSTAAVAGSGSSSGTNTTDFSIPDANQTGIASPITIGTATSASSIISVTIDTIIHPYTADLVLRLVAPDGSFITLASGVGGSGDNFINTVFTSTAGTSITGAAAPFTGTYLPQTPFSNLTGSANGTWNLRVIDPYSQDIGTLRKWSIALSPNTIVSYNWSPSTGLTSTTTQNTSASPTSTTTYQVIATDLLGCSATASTTVTISNPVVSAIATNPLCAGGTGSITTSVTGGTAPFTYAWSDGSTGQDLLNATGGFYSVVVTDAAGCTSGLTSSISSPLALSLGIGSSDASCGNNDGSASVSVSGGTQPYSYLWNNGATVGDIQNLAPGTYFVTVTDANGCSLTTDATVGSIGVAPDPTGPVTGPPGACRSQFAVTFNVAPVSGATSYLWTLPTGATGTSSSNSITVDFGATYNGGDVCVSVVNACGQSTPTCYNVPYFASVPSTPVAITGPAFACAGTTQTFTCTPAPRAEYYTWTAPLNSTIVSGQGTSTVTISFASNFISGSVLVKAGNCKGESSNRSKAFYSKPSTPGTMTGALNGVCANTIGVYSVPVSVLATSYNWSAPAGASIVSGQGTNSVEINFGPSFVSGNISVTASNICATSAARTVAVKSIPGTPGSIAKVSTVACAGTTADFSIIAVAGATSYTWNMPANAQIVSGQGTTAITVQFNTGFSGGTISVAATNNCGSSALRTLALTSNPPRPGTMTGAVSNMCGLTGVVYTVPVTPNTTSYTWTVPSFATIVSGQGTNSIIVDYGNTTGPTSTICVTANNACGSGLSRCIGGVTTLPLRPALITGSNSVCAGQQNISYSVVTQPGATYTWTVPASCTIVSGQGTGNIIVNWGASNGSINVVASNSCGSAIARSLSVAISCRIADAGTFGVNVYPNPARSFATLEVAGADGEFQMLLTDITGKILANEVIYNNTMELNLSGLEAGIYLVKVKSADGMEQVRRLTIQ